MTAPRLGTRATELGSAIGDQSDWIRACDASRYFTLYFSLFSLLVFGFWRFAVDCGACLRLRERESSLSFWTDSLSLSLSHWIYLLLFGQVFVSAFLPLFNLFALFFFFFLTLSLVCHYYVGQVLVTVFFFSVLTVLWFVNLCSSCVNLSCWVG